VSLSGSPVTNATVSFSSSDNGDKISATTNNGDGTYTATITSSTTVGAPTITATDSSVSPSATGSATLTQTVGPATKVSVSLSPTAIPDNGTSTATATASVTDAEGHAIKSDTVTFTSSDAGEKISATTNNGNGTYSATITSSTTVDTPTITATDSSVSPSVMGTAVLSQTSTTASGVALSHTSVVPTSLQAAIHSDVVFATSFSYTNPSDSVRDITLLLAPGLTANVSGPKCSVMMFKMNACPKNTEVGHGLINARIVALMMGLPHIGSLPGMLPGHITVPLQAHLYLLPAASSSDIAQIGMALTAQGVAAMGHVHCGFGQCELPNVGDVTLVPSATGGPAQDQIAFRQITHTALFGNISLSLTSLSLTFDGTTKGGAPFMTNPTSCSLATSTVTADSYLGGGSTTASSSFTPTGC